MNDVQIFFLIILLVYLLLDKIRQILFKINLNKKDKLNIEREEKLYEKIEQVLEKLKKI